MNIASLELSNTHSRKGVLFFATLYDYAESPRKTKKPDANYDHVLRITQDNNYMISSVGGNDFSEILFKVRWGGVK